MKRIPADIQIGSVHESNRYGKFKVIGYHGSTRVDIEFINTGFQSFASSQNVRLGNVKDKLHKSVFGVGFIGDGPHVSKDGSGHSEAYRAWANMLQRCYYDDLHSRQPNYSSCSVAEEWHNFQNFAEWFYLNHPNDGDRYEIDKDIKVSGNRIYSPDTCLFVSRRDNSAHAHAKDFLFVDPDGIKRAIHNLSLFCENNGLTYSSMQDVYYGKQRAYKGWTRS